LKQIFLIFLAALFLAPPTAFCQWHPLGAGPDPCHATRIFELGVDDKQNVYASGYFNDSTAPIAPDYYVAKWDGAKWSRFAPFKIANNLYAHNANVYATVTTDAVNNYQNVLRWNGAKLDTLKGLNSRGGYFSIMLETKAGNLLTTCTYGDGGQRRHVVMNWDGTQWDTLGKGASSSLLTRGTIRAMAEDNLGNIYVAGDMIDTTTRPHTSLIVLKWDGTTWSKVGKGSNGLIGMMTVNALTCDKQNNVYAAGDFFNGHNYITKWDGTSWSELGQGTPALKYYERNLLPGDRQQRQYLRLRQYLFAAHKR
jgi:hypothetical protein